MVPEVVITDDTQRPADHSAKRVTFRLLLAGWTDRSAVRAVNRILEILLVTGVPYRYDPERRA
jgi:hypothetical protein